MPRYSVITFDCYGTLIDWESGIADAFIATAAADGVTLTRESVLRAYAETEHRVQAQAYRLYREILRDTAARGPRARLAARRRTRGFLADSLPSGNRFPTPTPRWNASAPSAASASCRISTMEFRAAMRKHFTSSLGAEISQLYKAFGNACQK
jgi:hypothetical protein